MLRRIVEKSATDSNIIPEMYVQCSAPSFPARSATRQELRRSSEYGAGEYILHLLGRSQLGKPSLI